jgi:hypothetical protein
MQVPLKRRTGLFFKAVVDGFYFVFEVYVRWERGASFRDALTQARKVIR